MVEAPPRGAAGFRLLTGETLNPINRLLIADDMVQGAVQAEQDRVSPNDELCKFLFALLVLYSIDDMRYPKSISRIHTD